MTDIILTDTQADAVKRTKEWYQQCAQELADKKPLTQQVWRIFGFAGVGKSTVVKYGLAELGDIAIVSACFTGKAALVLTRKGTPATTIHSLCYKAMEYGKEAIEKAKQELALMEAKGPENEGGRLLWRSVLTQKREAISGMHRPNFALNPDSVARDAALIVLDEVSMVNEAMATDLMSFGRPIVVLGDPGQLPPIKGEGAFTQATPDVMLTEIHRQALDSQILRLATMAREGQFIPFGTYSDDVAKMHRQDFGAAEMVNADIVLVGYNATRFALNNAMRKVRGRETQFPESPDEKIICLKNQNDIGLVNGMFLSLSDCGKAGNHTFRANIKTEDGTDLGQRTVYRGHFDDHVAFDKDRGQRDYWEKKGTVECTFGDAITVHKGQGSEWENVILFDDGFGRGPDRAKWLYTACTRASDGLLILA